MTLRQTVGFVLGSALLPAIALADDPADPYAPDPAPSARPPAPPPSTPSTTTVVAPPPAPPQPPIVLVNRQPAPARTTVISHDPETYEVTDAWNAPVFATGAVVFAGSYAGSAIVAGSSDHVGAAHLYIPVVGPWLALDDWGDCPIEEPRCDKNTTDKVLLVADGMFQAAGVITMVTGLVAPSSHTVSGLTADATKFPIRPTRNGLAFVGKF